MPLSRTTARRGLALGIVLLLLVAGCDTTGGEETIVLTQGSTDEVEMQFEFVPANYSTGSTFTLTARPVLQNGPSLGEQVATYLQDEGAGVGPADLLSAELTRAELVIGLPPGEDWDFADTVILQLRAGEGNATDIAQATSLPSDDEVRLDELDRELASILSQPNPELLMRLTPTTLMQNEPTYTIRARLRFRFEVPL